MSHSSSKFDPGQVPPPLMTNKADNAFAHKTMAVRKPRIVQQVLADHAGQYPDAIVQELQNLHDELAQGKPVRPLRTSAPDGESWRNAWQPYQNKNWFNIPWYFAEVFFYRRLLESAGYFSPGPWAGVDPFLPAKQAELANEIPWQVLALGLEYASASTPEHFQKLLRHCIWGNRVDLSHPQIVEELRQQAGGPKALGELLADDTEAVLAHLQKADRPHARIDFICDNTGTELLLDFALADFLLKFLWAKHVTLHVKAHPTYVSDATPADVAMAVTAAKKQPAAAIQSLAKRLTEYQQKNRLQVQADLFWNSSRFFWEIPPPLHAQLAQAHLVVIKGDANYRRLLSDGHWPPDVPFAQAIPYFPAPFVALRTLKSDVVTGLQPGRAEALDQQDAEWRVNGRRGVIQAVL
ncbi:MAG: protein-glutamate O-methyltransferase family protein [Anaerolineae bacterium]|nr:protein-glutamate O-methyltransferase family protein [Anaerolineae bacterium]